MRVAERAVAWFLLFLAGLVWPLVAIANRPVLFAGLPALVLYLFALWAAIVVVIVLTVRGRSAPTEDGP